jgi:flagellar basal-body rod modification protein FlgD
MASMMSGILGSTDTSNATTGATDRLASDKETFLKLLVAQLTNQDPLNPTEDKEFITQLAQFTSLEQLQSINTGVGTLNTTMYQTQMLSAATYIGKSIVASGNQITKISDEENTYTTDIIYTLDQDIKRGEVHIFDAAGNLKYSDVISAKNAGSYVYNAWKGYDSAGKEAADGNYTVLMNFFDENDQTVVGTTQFVGTVTATMQKSGEYYLVLAGGREVKLTDVSEVYQGATATATGTAATEADAAADYAAAAAIATDNAAGYAAKAAAADAGADEAKAAANNALTAYNSASDAAKAAETASATARTKAEEAKTAASLEIANKAKARAEEAWASAEAARASALEAKASAIAKGATIDWDIA